jgi:HlyD family secretion protein
MAIIADMSKIIFKMNVDELDISKVELGQKVSVTADALTGKTFVGTIENKSSVGTTSNGVTTYPVTIAVENPEGLIPGMNVNAKVVVNKKDHVVKIPVSSLKRGNSVVVKLKDGEVAPEKNSKMHDTTPEGFKTIRVKTGLNDKDFIEIIEGIAEGDIILIPTVKATTKTTTATQPGGFPGAGAGGGMPTGGGNYNRTTTTGGGATR